MLQHNLRIKPYYSVIAHSANSVEFRVGVWNHESISVKDDNEEGYLYEIISRLNGEYSVKEITDNIGIKRSQIETVIDHLNELNLIESQPKTAFGYYSELYMPALESPSEDAILNNKKIIILSQDKMGLQFFQHCKDHLKLKQVELIQSDHENYQFLIEKENADLYHGLAFETLSEKFFSWQDAFVIVIMQTVDPVLTHRFNQIAHHLGISWIHAALDGPFIFVGPLCEPGLTACYACYETRVAMNLRQYSHYQRYKSALALNRVKSASVIPFDVVMQDLLISHLSLEMMNYLLTGSAFTKDQVLSIYLPTMEINFNNFLRLSACEVCGSQMDRDDAQPYFDVPAWLEETCRTQ